MGPVHTGEQVHDSTRCYGRAGIAEPVLLAWCRRCGLEIVRGGDIAVTESFARNTRTPLGEKFLPFVTRATEKVSLADRYNKVAAMGIGRGLIKADDANVQKYVIARTLDGFAPTRWPRAARC